MAVPLKTLIGHIPALMARRLATTPALIIEPIAQNCPAAILSVDVSSLTSLTNLLIKCGPAGSEELADLLKNYYTQLIDLLTQHGGDVVKFSGDTLLALWATEATNESLTTTALRAAQCATTIYHTFDQLHLTDNLHFSVRIGLGVGNVLTTNLGGVYGRWEFLVTGEPIVQVNKAKNLAAPGQIILSPQAGTLLEDKCTLHPLPEGYLRLASNTTFIEPDTLLLPTLTPQAEAALRGYIPGAFLARLGAIRTSLFSELLPITLLHINLPDLTYLTSTEKTQPVVRVLQTILYDYEGSVDKIKMDNQGTSLIAVLGLPPVAHEDDAVLGVQTALAMKDELQKLNLRGAIGIATGWAFCGLVGNKQRQEYTILGGIMDLAKKLMQTARQKIASPDQVAILCDAPTHEASHAHIDFATAASILIDDSSLVVYEPRADLSTANQNPSLPGSDNWLDSEMYEFH
jgi:class 3 adenylate cyclase